MGKVEDVARALCASDGANWEAKTDSETANGCTPDEQRDYWREKARAAIKAMREPTHHMIKAGGNAQTVRARANRWVCYRAMIDAALSEDKEQG